MVITFIRLPAVIARRAGSRSVIYSEVKRGLMPPPVRLGPQQSAWIEGELDEVLRARAAGKSEQEIKALIERLVAARSSDA